MEFHKRLEALRRERELKQIELAKACGVSLATYRRWEYGQLEPSLSQLVSLAKILETSVGALVGEEEQSSGPEKIILRHGPLSLEIPPTEAGLTFLEKRLKELSQWENSRAPSLSAG